ncbi:DUF305 domain-containing protein [Gordonia sp. HNM0687]|uniref:DUF305 domain-containing protein n=1 Tax=Gordonia mangrovi TaxID=2665643 RepID=A0A6L7GS73_9ACTN|nr:DUF305 domain-containing protein [Gordonia mangrovi]MXP21981.1 DUF305 domain-containing protein [Gordonia mangrovi]UVF76338.1 DUF305 domain-containing protein [Gordonia mangrovi]
MKRQIFVGSTIVAAALLGACSSTDDPAPSTSPTAVITTTMPMAPGSSNSQEHNDADVTFNQAMIPHHMQALVMADLVTDRTTTPAVRALADRIRDAQKPEIDEMAARLAEWGISGDGDGHSSGDHAVGSHATGHDMSGMMTPAQMTTLSQARGTEFDRMWLEGMIAHHEGAIVMADAELADGVHGPSRELAERVKATQQDEIDEMNSILRR